MISFTWKYAGKNSAKTPLVSHSRYIEIRFLSIFVTHMLCNTRLWVRVERVDKPECEIGKLEPSAIGHHNLHNKAAVRTSC